MNPLAMCQEHDCDGTVAGKIGTSTTAKVLSRCIFFACLLIYVVCVLLAFIDFYLHFRQLHVVFSKQG